MYFWVVDMQLFSSEVQCSMFTLSDRSYVICRDAPDFGMEAWSAWVADQQTRPRDTASNADVCMCLLV